MNLRFTFADIEKECTIETDCYQLDGRALGARVYIPEEIMDKPPYSGTAYDFLQQLRHSIFEFGTIEFPGLPVNKTNYTLAQRAPWEHKNNPNPYMTDFCQSPHQDTPPYPTAFWLEGDRHFFATWIMSTKGVRRFQLEQAQHPGLSIDEIHKKLVSDSLQDQSGILLNQKVGLLLIDNSHHQQLYHARTCLFEDLPERKDSIKDSAMYAFNEVGLLNYLDSLDIYRGDEHKSQQEMDSVRAFMENEYL